MYLQVGIAHLATGDLRGADLGLKRGVGHEGVR